MIRTTGSEQGGPPPDSTGRAGDIPNQEPENQKPENRDEAIVPVTRAERRRHLAQIIRVNPLDCFDASGAFDMELARRSLPPCAIHQFIVHETTRTTRNGDTIVQRRISLRLVDKIRAMRLDDALEEKQEKAVESAALQKIAHLEKALAEADARDLRDSRDLEEKDRQIETLQRARQLTETVASADAAPKSSDPVQAGDPESPDPEPGRRAEGHAEQAEAQRRRSEEIAIQSRIREIEHLKNTSGHGGFSSHYPQWPQEAEARRSYVLRLIKAEAEAAERQKIASAASAAPPTRPRSRPHPMRFAAQRGPTFH